MSTPVLIAYGTRHGCFEGVADKIGAMLKREGIDVMQVNLAKRHKKGWPPVEDFRGIVVGSSIKRKR